MNINATEMRKIANEKHKEKEAQWFNEAIIGIEKKL